MNTYKCTKCGGKQYSAADISDKPCVYCGGETELIRRGSGEIHIREEVKEGKPDEK